MPGVAAMSAPPVPVFSREPEVMVEMAKLVEVACWREVEPEIVTLPLKTDVAEVEVARSEARVGVEVETMRVPSKAVSMWLPMLEALVPPLSMGRMPETCVVSDTVPESVERPIQLFAIAKQPAAMVRPLA